MAPSPDNDTPKAPDKTDKGKPDVSPEENNKHDQTLSDLNDRELKALLDEAANYKNPKDREGKSSLFNYLLNEAEQKERNAMAARAGGSELVRYCNPSAKRSRHRKKPSSISENMMHGGSLDNLAKEELFETSKHRTKKSVSARQREGGSLPCNVNASTVTNLEYKFLEEARKEKEMREKMVAHDLEAESLLEHDCLAQDYQEQMPPVEIVHYPTTQPAKYTSRATLQINNKVDDPLQVSLLEPSLEQRRNFYSQPNPTIGNKFVYFPNSCIGSTRLMEEGKKVDENGNALQQNALKGKKKKLVTDKNVVVCNAESVKGHRSDIINDMEKLIEFIGGESSGKKRLKSKQLNPNVPSDDAAVAVVAGAKNKKQRAQSSKSKDDRSELTKSNSLGEISTTNLDDFCFDKDNVVMRNNKNSTDKPRERRSWGNMEPLPIQTLYSNASAENLESAEFRVVTKKKKSKKRRSSISGRPKPSSVSGGKGHHHRGPSPDPRRKSACSVPHSEKSNDSSDSDSVHSLPIDTHNSHLNMPISYADIAKNSETKPKEKKSPVTAAIVVTNDKIAVVPKETITMTDNSAEITCPSVVKNTPPDVHNIKNFPAITKQSPPPPPQPQGVERTKNSNKIKGGATKNVKNNVPKAGCVSEQNNEVLSTEGAERAEMHYSASLPPDIPTLQTIEKLQLMGQGHPYDDAVSAPPSTNDSVLNCDIYERTSNVVDDRPPVVILSGSNKEVPGLVFGFDVNEQLLSEDVPNNVCDDFISRWVPPDNVYTTTSHNHDKIVNFVASAWDETVANLSSGKVQYYSDSS